VIFSARRAQWATIGPCHAAKMFETFADRGALLAQKG
jgi:hypothetical protein